MKRRSFLQGLSAAAATPMVPGGALARMTTSGGMAAASAQPYLWAEFISRVHNRASPAMFERLLKLDGDTARRVYGELLRDNVVTAPDAFGLSRAANPYPQAHVTAGMRSSATTSQPAPKKETPSNVRKVLPSEDVEDERDEEQQEQLGAADDADEGRVSEPPGESL